jgi:hypothetical protein
VEVAVDHAEPHDGVVDRGERLVEPGLMRRGLSGNVDQLHVIERLAVSELDVSDPGVKPGQDRASLGLDHREVDVLTRERSDGVHGCPACDHDDLDPAIDTDTLDRGTEKPAGALKVRPDTPLEVGNVRVCLL